MEVLSDNFMDHKRYNTAWCEGFWVCGEITTYMSQVWHACSDWNVSRMWATNLSLSIINIVISHERECHPLILYWYFLWHCDDVWHVLILCILPLLVFICDFSVSIFTYIMDQVSLDFIF